MKILSNKFGVNHFSPYLAFSYLVNHLSPLNFKHMKKSITTTAKAAILAVIIASLFSSCIVSRGNGCPDARRMIGYGCYGGR